MKKSETIIYALSKKEVIFLYVYFFIYILIGGAISIMEVCLITDEMDQYSLLKHAFIASFAVSGMLCGVQYIRRLYKACISDRIDITKDVITQIGTVAYFVFRPIFTLCFVIVLITGILSGMYVVTGNLDYVLNEKFIYICMITSAYIGYSIGRTIDKFEKTSEKQIDELRV